MLRCICGVAKLDKIINERIRGTTKLGEIAKKNLERRLKWYGHVMRREEHYVGRRAMEMKVHGRRKRGRRPKRRWLDRVRNYIKEKGLSADVRFEDKAAETEGRVTMTGVNQDREESAGNIRKEEMIAGVEDEGEIRTEERKVICAGATLMATHTYTRNPESPLGKEIDLQQWDTLIFKGEHAENEHWRLVEDRNGQVGYAPAAFLVVILDTAEEEEESDATKKGLENSTEENRIGQEGERRKSYSAAVIDGIKRKSRIFVGDSIVRKTDTRLSKEEDVVVCLPGARIEHVTERVEKIMGRGKGGTILVHIGTNNADKEGTTAIVDKYRKLLKKTKEARVEQIILSGILPVFGNRIDGYRNSKRMAINGMVKRLCKEEDVGYVDLWDSFVGKEGMYARDGLHLSGKGAAVFAEGLSGAVASGLGKVRYLN